MSLAAVRVVCLILVVLDGHAWDLEGDRAGYTRATEEELTAEIAEIFDAVNG